ncbi:DEA(D/H)-box RNA helicase family protein [Actinidia rufa]|uniref:DEA(D/H)-box RNA helicase family protein n=1 Tax=Actinidia rufa TaxID=165716 RepID=A0A7J0DH69_9ERIC|nr:DEA(D/H)-box RNA helicase family protein [Actinidia rufa]
MAREESVFGQGQSKEASKGTPKQCTAPAIEVWR